MTTVDVRLILARFEDDDVPTIVGCIDRSIWEHWEDADEQAWRAECQRRFGLEPTDMEWRECWASFSPEALAAAFETPTVTGSVSHD